MRPKSIATVVSALRDLVVAAKGAKAGMMLFEVRRAAAAVADILRAEEPAEAPVQVGAPVVAVVAEPLLSAVPSLPAEPAQVHYAQPEQVQYTLPEPVQYAQAEPAPAWSSYAPSGSVLPGDNPTWS